MPCPRGGSRSATMASSVPASGGSSTNCGNGWAACRLPKACHPPSHLKPGTRRRLTGPGQRSCRRAVQPVVRPYNGHTGSDPAAAILLDLDRVAFLNSSMGAELGCQRGGPHIASRLPNRVRHIEAAMMHRPTDAGSTHRQEVPCLLRPASTRIVSETAGYPAAWPRCDLA